ncbi:hypothetical protein A2U01_0094543, partial [Trifolium medium]|nr:hypothetical protein [Trifolium medium]
REEMARRTGKFTCRSRGSGSVRNMTGTDSPCTSSCSGIWGFVCPSATLLWRYLGG